VKRPVWEDPLNANGGKWIIRLRKGVSDRLWEDLIVAVIGDQFENEDGVCGCVLSVRSNEDILSIWNRDDKDADAKARIRDSVRRLLNLPPNVIMEYKSNNGAQNLSATRHRADL
jgi:translation initiation factor 4E